MFFSAYESCLFFHFFLNRLSIDGLFEVWGAAATDTLDSNNCSSFFECRVVVELGGYCRMFSVSLDFYESSKLLHEIQQK